MNDPTVDWTDGTVPTVAIASPVRTETYHMLHMALRQKVNHIFFITGIILYLSPQFPLISSQRAGRGQKIQSRVT